MDMDRHRLQFGQDILGQAVPFRLGATARYAQHACVAVWAAYRDGQATVRDAEIMGIPENAVKLYVPLQTAPIDRGNAAAGAVQGGVFAVQPILNVVVFPTVGIVHIAMYAS